MTPLSRCTTTPFERISSDKIGFGQAEVLAPAVTTSPWTVAIVTSVIGAATGWVLEEVSKRKKKR